MIIYYYKIFHLISFFRFGPSRPAASWTSTPDLGNLNDDTSAEVTVSLTLPRKRLQPLPEISTKIKEIENKEKGFYYLYIYF